MSKARALNWLARPGTILHPKRWCRGLLWMVSCLVLLLFVWVVGGNLAASFQERKVDQTWEQLLKQFPKTEMNNSALKLNELTTALGVGALGGEPSIPIRSVSLPTSKGQTLTFEDIGTDLENYLKAQYEKLNDEIDIPPERLQSYLSSHTAELEAIRTHVLSNDLPQWELDLSLFDPSTPLPSFLYQANFQRLLALDILEKTRQGQTQEALKTLEVSWKLTQALLELPRLIAQLVHIISGGIQIPAMRKMHQIPTEWQERIAHLIQYEQPQPFLRSLEVESFMLNRSLKKYSFSELVTLNQGVMRQLNAEPLAIYSVLPWLGPLPDLLLTPYLRLVGVDRVERVSRMVRELPKEDFCQLDPEAFAKRLNIFDPWWSHDEFINPVMDSIQTSPTPNHFLDSWIGGWIKQWRKVGRQTLFMELTQKVWQVKDIASKQGHFPQQVPGLEASICRDAKWIYQVSPDGKTMSIAFDKREELDWLRSTPSTPNDLIHSSQLQ